MSRQEHVDFKNTALVLIDMQYESAPTGFWKTHNWDSVVTNAKKVLEAAREIPIPVVYVRVARRPDGVDAHEFDLRDEEGKPIYSVKDTRGAEIVQELKPKPNDIIVDKQRFSAFYQTNLDIVLQGLKAKHLTMCGVFTDSCFLTSVYDAFFRGYRISIVKDACGAGTEAAHKTSILDMANWVYGCNIFRAEELVKALRGEEYTVWHWEKPNTMRYATETINKLYDRI
jgi:nicotinamidase-related amidase